MLVNMKEMLNRAMKGSYCVPAFNCFNLDIVPMVIRSAEKLNAPVIINAQEKGLRYTGFKQFAAMVTAFAAETKIPVVLHLDHGQSLEVIEECLKAGFTSVMFDGSHLPLEDNIAKTARMVKIATVYGASTEGELGMIPGTESGIDIALSEQQYTDPEEARRFIRETGVDALAVSIGTIHIMQKKMVTPDQTLLRQLRSSLDIPLVLHGGAAVTDQTVRELVAGGINKYNINFYLNAAFILGLKKELQSFTTDLGGGRMGVPVVDILMRVQAEVAREVCHRIELLGAGGKVNRN